MSNKTQNNKYIKYIQWFNKAISDHDIVITIKALKYLCVFYVSGKLDFIRRKWVLVIHVPITVLVMITNCIKKIRSIKTDYNTLQNIVKIKNTLNAKIRVQSRFLFLYFKEYIFYNLHTGNTKCKDYKRCIISQKTTYVLSCENARPVIPLQKSISENKKI